MQAAISKLVTENEELRSKSEEILSENQRLAGIISSWTRSSVSLQRLHGATKQSGDKIGLATIAMKEYSRNQKHSNAGKDKHDLDILITNADIHAVEQAGPDLDPAGEEHARDDEHAITSVYESTLVEFFANAKVLAGTIVIFVANRKLAIKKEVFAEAFGLPTQLMDTQNVLKLDFGRYKNIYFEKVDKLATNVTTSQTALKTSLIRQLVGQQYQLTTDLDMVKLKLEELVEHLKRIGDAKKGEGGQSRPVDGSSRQGGEGKSGGQSTKRGRGPSPRGGRGPSPGS
ncbi:hypothetical protein F511_37828 [Dorcoceras hygrometricum]|uniref:Uncharacterized protein n=1 Tax=Dorcoceras hygrometricum TaxID=472368 RepID=A0A2Z7BTI7_9LAMI|nr:hypothetical protein F511_37828 [Dorcoceras hygrometricum]